LACGDFMPVTVLAFTGVWTAGLAGTAVCAGVALCCANAAAGRIVRLATRTLEVRLEMRVIIVFLFHRGKLWLVPA